MGLLDFSEIFAGQYLIPSNDSGLSVPESLGYNLFGGSLVSGGIGGVPALSFESEEDAEGWLDWIWNGIEKAAGGIITVGTDIIKSLPPITISTSGGGVFVPQRTGTPTQPGTRTINPRTGQIQYSQVPGTGGIFENIDTKTLLIGGGIALALILVLSRR